MSIINGQPVNAAASNPAWLGQEFFTAGITSTATAGGTTTLTSLSTTLQVATGSLNQTYQLPNATTLATTSTGGRLFRFQNDSTGALTIKLNDGSTVLGTVNAGAYLWCVLKSNATTNGTWDLDANPSSGGGTGTGAKNYLSVYTASLSGNTANVGNGNFEANSTNGWSLAHSTLSSSIPTSTASAGSVFSSSSGGSAATALSIAAFGSTSNAQTNCTLTNAANTVSVGSATGIFVGQLAASGTSGFPAGAFVIGISGTTVYLNANFTGTTTSTATVTFSSTPLGGLYSGALCTNSTSSKPSSTAGDLLISSAFYIDAEDQAKILQIKFYYQNQAGSTLAFQGTTSGSFAIYIYDVTNGAWIQPAGVYNTIQGTGVGYATATFQTTSNSTQYQIAIVNITATSAPYVLWLDDIFVGPQTAPTAPAMTDMGLNAWTPTGAFTTNTTYTGDWARVGKLLKGKALLSFAGAPNSVSATLNLPFTMDTTAMPTLSKANFGSGTLTHSGTTYNVELIYSSTTALAVVYQSAITGAQSALTQAAPVTIGNGDTLEIYFTDIPIVGWSSNSNVSSDTDTRVVAVNADSQTPTGTLSNSYNVAKFTVNRDTHAGYSASTGLYTVAVTGFYQCSATLDLSATWSATNFFGVQIGRNGQGGSDSLYGFNVAQVTASTDYSVSTQGLIYCNAGDTLGVYSFSSQPASLTYSVSKSGNFFSFTRVSGPAVVTAVETVAARYYVSSGSSTSGGAAINFDTKLQDTHGAVTTGAAWKFTTPVSGTYSVSFGGATTSATVEVELYINGSAYLYLGSMNSSTQISGHTLVHVNFNDTIQLAPNNTFTPLSGGPPYTTTISIVRVGN
jgi:hypothetical protein